MRLLLLTRCLQDFLDLANCSLLLFIQVLHSDGIAQLWRWGLQIKRRESIKVSNCINKDFYMHAEGKM